MTETAIQGKHLQTGYRQKILIDEALIKIPKGKITVLLGGNGCGKSTLLRTLAGLHPKQSGEVWIGNRQLETIRPRQLAQIMAFLPQHPQAPETLTINELVMLGRYPYRKGFLPPSKTDKQAVNSALANTDLLALAEQSLGNISGGQRQRAWLAMILAQETDILMLDEPTSYLDLSHQYDLLNLIKHLNDQHQKTILIVLHDLNQAFEFADHLIYMKNGKVITQGSPAETASESLIHEVFNLRCSIQQHPESNCPLLVPLAGRYAPRCMTS
ncbi:ABC transporter ATP-binding protein [Aliamphritea ceti]|uniref:ABC transporter ATP-binding protein n=1 Tax=Aliamphritea ceti TaxID=1524258 RepID=UPI0021C40683|nr:ABC transporter ATP-binding protein [Aliamphritea ceti]